MRMSPDTDQSIRCTVSGCSCVRFKPGSVQLRSCDHCGHGWVAHALDKLQARPPSRCGPVEVALPWLVFDLSSLVLYGAQAVPVRLKILLDRLYSVLTPEQVGHILQTLNWSLGDYVRGYMLQYPRGKVLDRWFMATPEEELLILKQFLRFGETRPIVELMAIQCMEAVNHISESELKLPSKSCQSNINTNTGTLAMLRNSRDSRLVAGVGRMEKNGPADQLDTVQHFENFPGGLSLLLPFHFPSSAFQCLVPPTKELVLPSKLTQCLRQPGGTKLTERKKNEGGRREGHADLNFHQSEDEQVLKVKKDPDKPNPPGSHQNRSFHHTQKPDLRWGMAKQETTSSLPSSLNFSPIPSSPSLYPSISSPSSSLPNVSKKLQVSTSSSLHPLPSFSSSFLSPIPATSFSSSLQPHPSSSSSVHPLPSSLSSFSSPSLAGGRKGRVCCGVCGKSFYDKGTLKIHYNAVHLKIKHCCTVVGCTMVFSSLRSRNRHSANPNPRLHTGGGQNAHCDRTVKQTQTQIHETEQTRKHDPQTRMWRDTLWTKGNDAQRHVHTMNNGIDGRSNPQHGCQHNTPCQVDSPPRSSLPLPQTLNEDNNQSLNNPLTLPSPPLLSPPSLIPLVVPVANQAERFCHLLNPQADNTDPASLPHNPATDTTTVRYKQNASHDSRVAEGKREETSFSQLTDQPWQWELAPKKKPRKSSMPVKIERDTLQRNKNEDEEDY